MTSVEDTYSYVLSGTERDEYQSGRLRKKAYIRYYAAEQAKHERCRLADLCVGEDVLETVDAERYVLPVEYREVPKKEPVV